MEFKNLAEVTQLEEVPEGASVLATTAEGDIVRVPSDGMEIKNLAEVTQLEEVPEGASVLATTAEGDIVRVPGDGLGGSGGIAFFDVEYDPYNNGGILSCPTFAEVDALYAGGQYPIAVLKGEAHGEVNNAYMPLISCYVGGQYVFALQGATLIFQFNEEPSLTFGTE